MAKKVTKKRKPMTPAQRAAAIARLEVAREKRMKENPPEYRSVHPDVLALDEDATLSMKNVKAWIKTQKGLVSKYKKEDRQGVKGALAKSISAQGYVAQMMGYLSSGMWNSMVYGEYGQMPMKFAVINKAHLAYDSNGNVKRTVGVWYCDIGEEWTKEMEEKAKGV